MKQVQVISNKQKGFTVISNKQKGFTLIEMSVVLVIIGVLIGGIVKGKSLIDDSNATLETQTMQLLASNLHARYMNEADTSTLTNTAAITSRIVPPGYNVVGAAGITNGNGGTITLTAAPDALGTPNNAISVAALGYNFATCKKIATAFKKNAISIKIGATLNTITNAAPLTGIKIDTDCSAADAVGPIPVTLVILKNS